MSESDLLAADHIDGLDGLENGQDGDAIMQCDGVKRELNEANIDDPVAFFFIITNKWQMFLLLFLYKLNFFYILIIGTRGY